MSTCAGKLRSPKTINPYEPGTPEISCDAIHPDAPQPGVLFLTWRAMKQGARMGAIVGGAISLLLIIPAVALVAFGLGSGGGWVLPKFFFYGIGFFLFCVGFAGLVGAHLGLILAVIGLAGRPRDAAAASARRAPPIHHKPGADISAATPRRLRALWPWLVGVPMLLIIATSFGIGAYVGGAVERRRAAAIATAESDTAYWRLDDLLAHREQVPDEENSALVMDQIVGLLPRGWLSSSEPRAGEQGTRIGRVKEEFSRLNATPENVRLNDTTAKTFRRDLTEYDNAVRLARSLEGYRRGRHELEIGPTVLDTLLPQTEDARIVARLMVVDAAVRAHDGDFDGALDSCRAIFGAGRSIGDEPFLISQLVRFAIGAVALQSTCRVIGQGEPSEAALARAQATILDELAQPLLLVAMRGERAASTEMIRRVADGEISLSALSGSPKPDPMINNPSDAPSTKLWFDFQYTLALEWMDEAVAIAKRSPARQSAGWKAWQANVDRVKNSRLGLYTAMLPLLMSPAIASAGSGASRYQAGLGATEILIAAERHRRKTGRWPASIDSIEPSILSTAPVDPYSGQPFRIEHRGGQFFVYSIGPNRTVEHGEFDPKRWLKGGPDDVGAHAWDVSLRRQPPAREDR
jgi:hypothetical protein